MHPGQQEARGAAGVVIGVSKRLWRALGAAVGLCAVMAALPAAAQADERPYGSIRGWQITAGFQGTRHITCSAHIREGAQDMSLMRDVHGAWMARVTGPALGASREGIVEIDGTETPLRIDAFGSDLFFVMPDGMLDAVRAGSFLRVRVPGVGESARVPLNGTAAATAKIDECFNLGGVSPSRPSAMGGGLAGASGAGAGRALPDGVAPAALAQGQGCPVFGTVASTAGGVLTKLTFVNRAGRPLTLYWIDPGAVPIEMARLEPGQEITMDTATGHVWVLRGIDGACLGGLIETPASGGRLFVQ